MKTEIRMGLGCSVSNTTTPVRQGRKESKVTQDEGARRAHTRESSIAASSTQSGAYCNATDEGRSLGSKDLKPMTLGNVNNDNANPKIKDNNNNTVTIIHFNDVYNIEPRDCEPVGGAARFVTKVKEFSDKNPLILFSGDCLNPSLMSTVTKGRHMIPVLNKIGVHAALYGNHDFDFGVDDLIEFKNKTKFSWLFSNVTDNLTGDQLAEGVEKLMLEWQGIKIGIIGLIEEEWLVTLATVDRRDVTYEDYIEVGTRLASELRKSGAELIIALTHMRVPNDEKLLHSDADIDLILGGHDHHYEVKKANGKVLVKSGSDFRELSQIDIHCDENSNIPDININKIVIDGSIEEDNEIKKITEEFAALIPDEMELDLGNISVDLDGRFSTIRTQESNLGNFIADIMRMAMQTDAAILNGGSLRSDRVHEAGPFRLKDLVSILPMMDILVVIAITGEKLVQALENGVSQYPKHEGRFPQVSGIQFSFNPELPAGQRILGNSVKVNGQCLDWNHEYRVCVKSYLASGKDGYDIFRSCRKLVDKESGQILPTIVQNHFESLKMISGLRKSVSGHRQSVIMNEDVGISEIIQKDRCRLAPKVEGRIRIVTFDVENQENTGTKPRTASPKPRGRTARLKSISAPSAALMGLVESQEDDNTVSNTGHENKNDAIDTAHI